MVGPEWTYEPETERWIKSNPEPEADCVLVELEDGGGVKFTSRGGYKLGWCETHQKAEWMPLGT